MPERVQRKAGVGSGTTEAIMVTCKPKLDIRECLSVINGTFQTRLTAEEVGTRKASSFTAELAWVTQGFKWQGYFE